MVNQKENPVEWALLSMELDDAKEHLEELINQIEKNGVINDEDFKVQIFHVITHLNRIWNSKDHRGDINEKDFQSYSNTPKEFFPIG